MPLDPERLARELLALAASAREPRALVEAAQVLLAMANEQRRAEAREGLRVLEREA